MCDSRNSRSPKMTPLKGAFLAANPAGFLIYNKINHGTIWPFHRKDKDALGTAEGSNSCVASSSKKLSKKEAKKAQKNKLELEHEMYGHMDGEDARSTSSEVAPPVYSRK